MKRLLFTVLVAATAMPVGQQTLGGQEVQQPVFRSATDVVSVDVAVRRRNAPVNNLTAADFELRDNGVVQSVDLRSGDAVPIDVSVVLNIQIAEVGRLRSNLRSDLASIARWLGPSDRLRLVAYGTDVREVVPLQATQDWPDGRLPADTLEQAIATLASAGAQRFGLHSLFDALLFAMAKPPEPGRRNLVIPFCYAVDNRSVLSDANLLKAIAGRTNALLHVALWGGRTEGLPTDSLATVYTREALDTAAEATGGEVHYVGSGGVSAFKDIVNDVRRSYLLQYTLKGVPVEGWHDISIRLPKYPDYTVRARKGYVGR